MTGQLRHTLSDLVEAVPEHVVGDDLARTAWAGGRRRRWRRRVAVASVSAAVFVGLVLGLPSVTDWTRSVQPAGSRSGQGVDGYPERIGHQWWVRDLPDRPGPMAGLVAAGTDGSEWRVVSEDGHQWRIPSAQFWGSNAPTLSSTGRYLAYFTHYRRPPLVVHDLVTGERRVLDDVWPHGSGQGHPNMIHMQTPAFWAPDDSRVLFTTVSGPVDDNLLLTPSGEEDHIRAYRYPAGWIGREHLAFLTYDERGNGGVTGATVTIVDVSGAVTRRVALDVPRAFRTTSYALSQWSAVVSPDGTSVAVMVDQAFRGDLYRFSLQDGALLSGPVHVEDIAGVCQLGWRGRQPVVPTYPDQARGALAVVAGAKPAPMVVADPLVHGRCLMLAADAADGHPHGGIFGTWTGWWTWWWKEAVLAAALVVLLGWALRRRGRLRKPTEDAGTSGP